MKLKETLVSPNSKTPLEVVVGVFSDANAMSRVAASIRGPEVMLQRVSLKDPTATDAVPEIAYEDIDSIGVDDMSRGVLTGGAIGFSSGILASMPAVGTSLFLIAPLAGLMTGAWIGSVAGIDEAHRGMKLPNAEDYESMLSDGKSLLVISGDEVERKTVAAEMLKLGAKQVFQHPPVQQFVR